MPTGDGVFTQATTVEESVVKQIAPKRHIVVFSTDGKVQVPVYKCSDGRHHATWRDPATGARLSKPKKKREDAIQLARDVCARLWEQQGFGRKEDCRVLVGEPRRNYERKNHVFGKPCPAACKTVRFKPAEFGWRPYLIELVYSSDLTSAGKVILLYVWDRGFTTGEFFASKRKTAKDTRLSLRYLKDIFPDLERRGWLIPIGRGDGDIARYGLLMPADIYVKLKAATKKRRHPDGGGTKFPPPSWELTSDYGGTQFR